MAGALATLHFIAFPAIVGETGGRRETGMV